MLAVEHVTKRFGGLVAVNEASLTVPQGRITGLIGPNGAGKTTLFAVIAGFEPPTAGRVLLDGADITAEPVHRRAARGIARTLSAQPSATNAQAVASQNTLARPSRLDSAPPATPPSTPGTP